MSLLEGADNEQSDMDIAQETSGDIAEAGQRCAGLPECSQRGGVGWNRVESLAMTQVSFGLP